jgi:hypothetical protein
MPRFACPLGVAGVLEGVAITTSDVTMLASLGRVERWFAVNGLDVVPRELAPGALRAAFEPFPSATRLG